MSEVLPYVVAKHDPEAIKCGPWGMDLFLDPGVSLVDPPTGTPSLAPFDSSGVALEGVDFNLLDVAFSQVDATSNMWSISYHTQGTAEGMFRVAWHYFKSDGTDDHVAMRLESIRQVAIAPSP